VRLATHAASASGQRRLHDERASLRLLRLTTANGCAAGAELQHRVAAHAQSALLKLKRGEQTQRAALYTDIDR
jgi:hypothetical protein